MKKHKACELVEDMDVYPRNHIDDKHVSDIAKAMEVGATMPPVVIEKGTNRIVDGLNRTRAYRKLYGDDYVIECVEKEYATDAELFLDAMRLNASHGVNLNACDRARCITIAEKLKIADDALATSLHMTLATVSEMRVDRIATSSTTGLQVPLKRTIRHMSGSALSPEQMEANDKLSGMAQVFYVNQLITLIESKLLNTDDMNLMDRMLLLADHLDAIRGNVAETDSGLDKVRGKIFDMLSGGKVMKPALIAAKARINPRIVDRAVRHEWFELTPDGIRTATMA